MGSSIKLIDVFDSKFIFCEGDTYGIFLAG